MKETITPEFSTNCLGNFKKNPKNELIMNAVVKNGIDNIAINHKSIIEDQQTFSQEIDTGKVTNQKKSGRCWMFAGLNILRQRIIEKYKIKDFELSQCYTMFWDKFEKSNLFLENIIETMNEKSDSRNVMWLLTSPIPDGGHWDMCSGLVEKYGIVPKYVMPETVHSEDSSRMNSLLATRLRRGAIKIRNLNEAKKSIESIREEKKNILSDIYKMLCCFLGEPPVKFNFEYRDTDKKFHRFTDLTPVSFYKDFIDVSMKDYVCLINDPSSNKKYNTNYTLKFSGNIKGGQELNFLNVDMETFKNLTIAQLKDNEPVWFGCDVGKMSDRALGIMDIDLYNYSSILGIDFGMTKAERLEHYESNSTHAMVLTGVNLADDKPDRWKVQNSWGDTRGSKGYFVMSDAWFDEFTYQVVINKKYLSDELKAAYEKKPSMLSPWDPMGSLSL